MLERDSGTKCNRYLKTGIIMCGKFQTARRALLRFISWVDKGIPVTLSLPHMRCQWIIWATCSDKFYTCKWEVWGRTSQREFTLWKDIQVTSIRSSSQIPRSISKERKRSQGIGKICGMPSREQERSRSSKWTFYLKRLHKAIASCQTLFKQH